MESAIDESKKELRVICQMCRNVLAKAEGLLEQLESAPASQPKRKQTFENEVALEKARILSGRKSIKD